MENISKHRRTSAAVKACFQPGDKVGRLTIKSYAGFTQNGRNKLHRWLVSCDCGTQKTVGHAKLVNKIQPTISCGCFIAEACGDRFRQHGKRSHPSYNTWRKMVDRCTNPKSPDYKDYGGRGITIEDPRWLDVALFIEDMGEKPKGLSIDRIDVNRGYCKENCRWADDTTQARNKRSNRYLTAKGKTQLLAEWANMLGCRPAAILHRINAGWSEEDAVTIPIGSIKPGPRSGR